MRIVFQGIPAGLEIKRHVFPVGAYEQLINRTRKHHVKLRKFRAYPATAEIEFPPTREFFYIRKKRSLHLSLNFGRQLHFRAIRIKIYLKHSIHSSGERWKNTKRPL